MYLLACSALFALASLIKQVRIECLILAVTSFLTWSLTVMFLPSGDTIYWLRAAITTSAAIALCGCRSLFGFYQASIYVLTLAAYALLAFDVAQYYQWVQSGSIGVEPYSLVWGERYRGLIHGLVICQFVGFIPIIWAAIVSMWSNRHNSSADLFRNKRGFR